MLEGYLRLYLLCQNILYIICARGWVNWMIIVITKNSIPFYYRKGIEMYEIKWLKRYQFYRLVPITWK